jgi:ribA/ribD-fused uncharacterized protein
VAYKVVVKATYLKFTVSTKAQHIQPLLLGTGNREIVETSGSDKIWGCGLSIAKAKAFQGDKWPGRNLLGRALMEVRERIKKENQIKEDDEDKQDDQNEHGVQDEQSEEGEGREE